MNRYRPGRPVGGPSAWHARSFSGPADFTVRMPEAVVRELRSLVQDPQVRSLRYDQLDVRRFEHDAARRFMDEHVRPHVYGGRGFVLVDGLDAASFGVGELEKIYWLLGQSLGEPVSQSAAGDFLGHVEDRTPAGAKEYARGYIGRRVLPLHSDGDDVMGLMCIRPARSGGTTVLSSVHTIHDELLATAPEVLPVLFEGFHYHRKGEQADGAPLLTPYRVPVLHDVDSMLACHYVRSSIEVAQRETGRPMPADQAAALEAFDCVANAEHNRIEFDLRAGQMLFANNYTLLHARTEFEDFDERERKRLMLRLWLVSAPRWNVPRELLVYENASDRPGIDPKPGGSQASADYLHRYAGDSAALAHQRAVQA